MHVLVWEFHVRPGSEPAFEAAYGPTGDWARLFGEAPGFLGTELLRDPAQKGRYLTLDRWDSADAFADFRAARDADYRALDARCEPWTTLETSLGAFAAAS